jgi:spermidine synthase
VRWAVAPLGLAALLALPVGTVKAETTGGARVVHEADTSYQYARVVEQPDGRRQLELNEGQAVHSVYRPDTVLTGDYWDEFLAAPLAGTQRVPGRLAILGDGAGTMVRAYERYFPSTRIDAVEIDGELTDIGRRYFGLRDRPGVRFFAEDARPFLRRAHGGYDAIFVDAYRQPYIPFYLATKEFFELVRERLAPDGVMAINIGHPEGSDQLEEVLTATASEVFPSVVRDPVRDTNTVLLASRTPLTAENLRQASESLPPDVAKIARGMADRLGAALAGGSVYTDDHAPVEWLVDRSIVSYAAGQQ